MRRTSLCLMIALALGACSDSTAPERPVDPSALRLQIVSGDRQTAPVAPHPSAAQTSMSVAAQQLPDNLLPEPLVARIVVEGETGALNETGGKSLPDNTVVTYRVIQPTGAGNRHCGSSFIDADSPDGQGYVTTYWERGTYAGECRMEVRLVAGGVPRVDTVFVAEFEPGAIVHLAPPGSGFAGPAPREISGSEWRDAHGNPGAWRIEADSVFRVFGTEFGTAAARTIEPIDMTPGAKDEAVICITTADGPIAVAHARYSSGTGGTTMWIYVHGHPDTTRAWGVYQLSDCS